MTARTIRPWLLIGAFVAIVVALLTLTRRPAGLDPLDPTNPKPEGGQAIARVLADRGVPVRVVDGQRELLKAAVDGRTTLVVSSTDQLVDTTTRTMLKHARAAGAVVLLQPDDVVLKSLHLDLVALPAERDGAVPAGCDDPLLGGLRLASSVGLWYAHPDEVDLDGGNETAAAHAARVDGCFPLKGAFAVWHEKATAAHAPLWLVGSSDPIANERVEKRDNAAIGLRLLGQHDKVVWYLPRATDGPATERVGVATELPRALFPGLGVVVIALLLLMIWRGRRLGRLVFEPLPVTVKAVETTLGRGRLYRKANDRDHAALVLRRATRARLAHALRLPPETTLPAMAQIVAARSGRRPEDCLALLADAPVTTDSHLAELARGLRTLEKEVSLA